MMKPSHRSLLLLMLTLSACPRGGTAPPVVSATPAPPPEVNLGTVTDPTAPLSPGPVRFSPGSAQLLPESDAALEIVRKVLVARPRLTLLRIEGHTNNQGLAASNLTLSELRTMSVARWLLGKGVRCDRLLVVGFGQSKPVSTENTPEARAKNERIEFVPALIDGRPINDMPVHGDGHVSGDPCS